MKRNKIGQKRPSIDRVKEFIAWKWDKLNQQIFEWYISPKAAIIRKIQTALEIIQWIKIRLNGERYNFSWIVIKIQETGRKNEKTKLTECK